MKLNRGFTLPELSISLSIFVLFLLVFAVLMKSSETVFHRTESSHDALLTLQKVRGRLEPELRQSLFKRVRSTDLTGYGRGNAIWFLTAREPSTGEMFRDEVGAPVWRYNVIYYTAVPTRHDELFGVSCADDEGSCPHKFLIRRVVRKSDWTTGPLDATPTEEILRDSGLNDYCVRPDGYGLNLTGGSHEEISTELIATGILDFTAELGSAAPWENEVQVRIATFDLEKAGQKMRLGQENLLDSPLTSWMLFSIFPEHGG